MPRVSIHSVGSLGVVRDLPPHLLPPEAWSDAQNVRFQDNKVVKFTGHAAVFDPPSVAPYWAMAVPTDVAILWLYAGLAKVYTVAMDGVHTEITRASGNYTGTAVDKWNGGVLGGLPVITNGVDDPQLWSPAASGTKLVDLTNWPANTTCKFIHPLKNYLVALHITESGTVKPYMIRWSHPADPGSVPSSWDDTDAAKDAGKRELSDSQAGIIQDAMLLRDILVIYKDNSIWGMQHIGGRFIFRTFPIFTANGILTTRCVATLPDGFHHLVANGDDLIVHDGQQARSVINKTWKRFINDNINPDELVASFVISNPLQDEMWFCFPEIGSTLASLAVVWNIRDGAIGVRELDNATFIALGVIDETGTPLSWDGDSGSWDGDTSRWGSSEFAPQALRLLQLDSVNTKLFNMDRTNQFDAANMTSFVEREGLALVGTDRAGRPKVDIARRKLLKRIWPKAEGGPFEVRVGSQQDIGGALTFEAAQTFTPGTDRYLDFTTSGALLAVRFQSSSNVAWQLHGYDLDIEVLGEL